MVARRRRGIKENSIIEGGEKLEKGYIVILYTIINILIHCLKIAEELGSTRTDVQCLHRWNKVLKVSLLYCSVISRIIIILFVNISASA